MKKRPILLDCTLRDGGYYTNWNFDTELAEDLVGSLNKAGMDILELGYKTPLSHKSSGFEGLFRYCTESQLQFLKDYDNAEYAFMIDAKEFLVDGKVDPAVIKECIPPANESLFQWVRVASHYATYKEAVELVSLFKDLGYKTGINLMGISLLKEEEIQNALEMTSEKVADVFYFADSFGSLCQEDVTNYITFIRNYFSGKIGIHAHDNQGMAFTNTLAAIEAGVDFVDSTIMGMGRGAGNLKTEQLLPYLYFNDKIEDLNPSEVLDVIDKHFIPLHQEYRWGWDYTYMLSALKNIHPTYCQNLRSTKQYSIEQISGILSGIKQENRKKFSEEALTNSLEKVINQPVSFSEEKAEIPLYKIENYDSVLVIGTGNTTKKFKQQIQQFIQDQQPLVIECNPENDNFKSPSKHYLSVILNWVRLKECLQQDKINNPIVTGLSSLPINYQNKATLYTVPCHISNQELEITPEKIVLPSYVVGMFSAALATLINPNQTFLVGFDGYADTALAKQKEMEIFWGFIQNQAKIISLTPTTYSVNQETIYKYLT
jgi:4-hydroxy 2-oxovalerate aldolase